MASLLAGLVSCKGRWCTHNYKCLLNFKLGSLFCVEFGQWFNWSMGSVRRR